MSLTSVASLWRRFGAAFLLVASATTLRAQATPRPPAKAPGDTGASAAATAQAAASARLGRPVSSQEIADAIAKSGLSPQQVRARLQSAGYDPSLADPFIGNSPATPTASQSASFADALRAMGVLSGIDDGTGAAPVSPGAEDTTPTRSTGRTRESSLFGKELFARGSTSFDPILSGPVDPSYRLGVGDQIQLVATGQVEFAYQLDVRRDGTVLVPQVGQVALAGLTLDAARTVMRQRASRYYAALSSGGVRLDLSVSRIRSIAVFVIGEVEHPGTYQVSALSTAFHALVKAQGPTDHGSFRNIEVRRAGVVIRHLDLYDYILNGDASNDVRLEQGDVIFVPLSSRTVAVRGAVRRPGVFELTATEGFADLLRFTGGLLPAASTDRVQIDRILAPADRSPGVDRALIDVPLNGNVDALRTVKLNEGDVVSVFEIGSMRRNVVTIAGEVYQPGSYQLVPNMSVGDLVKRAQGLLPWALAQRVQLVRTLETGGPPEMLSLDLSRDSTRAMRLKEFDSLTVFNVRGASTDHTVSIAGAVRVPSKVAYSDSLRVRDIIDIAGGFEDYALVDRIKIERVVPFTGRVELLSVNFNADSGKLTLLQPNDRITVLDARVGYPAGQIFLQGAVLKTGPRAFLEHETLRDAIERAGGFREDAVSLQLARRRNAREFSDTTSIVFDYPLDANRQLDPAAAATVLQRDDRILVRSAPGFREQRFATVTGLFRYPGVYAINERQDKVKDLVDRAGGFLPSAYMPTFRLLRYGRSLGIDVERAMKGDRLNNIALLSGDVISVAPNQNTVLVAGAVARSALLLYVPGRSMNEYIDLAGGITEKGDIDATVVDYPSGTAKRAKSHFRIFHTTPEVLAGSVITVPEKKEESDSSRILTQVLQSLAGIASIALAYIAATKQ